MSVSLLQGARVVTPQGVLDGGWVHVVDGTVTAVGTGPAPDADRARDLSGAWLLPGFVDLHVHGGGGHDVTSSPSSTSAALAFHRAHGTTSSLVSLVTAPVEALVEQLAWIARLASSDRQVLGAHLEGPFLAAARCGAQAVEHMLLPDVDVYARLLAASDGRLRVITVAPELPGAVELVARVVASGVVAAVGHTDADFARTVAAIEAGASLATHLFNGMGPLHHREPGAAGAALQRGIACELINDGVHLHPAITSLVARTTPLPLLVTDCIDAAGVGDGHYRLGGQAVLVRDGQARLESTGALAGSTLTMDVAFRRAVQFSGLDVVAASAAASGNPARVLGLDGRIGSIAPGRVADLLVLDDDLRLLEVLTA